MQKKNLEENRFRGDFTPTIPSAVGGVTVGEGGASVATAVPGTAVPQVVLKLEWNGEIRLAELDHPVKVEDIKKLFKNLFKVSPDLTYCLPGDFESITIKSEADLELAQRFGGQPLKIMGIMRHDAQGVVEKEEENGGLDVYQCASKSLANQDVQTSPEDIKKLLEILDLKPRRLVKFGLASPQSLKKFTKTQDENDDEDGEEDDDEIATKVADDNWEKVSDSGDAEKSSDAVVSALRARGLILEPMVAHVLLRVLDIPPRRFVKLGLIDDIGTARTAYKEGGKLAAVKLFKEGPPHRRAMWGRSLGGGRGRCRGRGWVFPQDLPPGPKKHTGLCGHSPPPPHHPFGPPHPTPFYGVHAGAHHSGPPPNMHHHHHHHGAPHFRAPPSRWERHPESPQWERGHHL